jgi:alginate O-acetyltransferase complex protein AlgI
VLFSSGIFLCYFLPIFLGVYHLLDRKFKNSFILLASLLFYAWGGPLFIFVLLTTTLIDFLLVRWMFSIQDARRRKAMLVFSVTMNIGLLALFKYGNFIVSQVNWVSGAMGADALQMAKMIPPLAISFFTFESITYVVDVYRGVHPPLRNFREYLLYILLFPKLLAGPIVRYHEIAGQINGRFDDVNADMLLTGFYRFVTGLAKKVLIGNVLGLFTARVFMADASTLSSGTLCLALVAFSFQVYFDFSGYSDMASGLSKMMGFHIPDNFNNPLLSKSLTEFWQRWHITLGRWFRNYLYIPLGGNRAKNPARVYFNLAVVFLLCGFWHGSTWNFVLWGAWHGFFLIAERAFLLRWLEKIPGFLRMLYNFLAFTFCLPLFCLTSLSKAGVYYRTMLSSSRGDWLDPGNEFYLTLAIAILFSWWAAFRPGKKIQDHWYAGTHSLRSHAWLTSVTLLLFVICLIHVVWSPVNPFIYFRF